MLTMSRDTMRAPIGERIQALEQRLEHRRQRWREDIDEVKVAAQLAARKWLPVAAAAGAGIAALWLARRGRNGRRTLQYVTAGDAARRAQRRGVRWASLLGIASTAYRFATSPQGRLLADAIRRGVRHRD
jgi:hypothetical protein